MSDNNITLFFIWLIISTKMNQQFILSILFTLFQLTTSSSFFACIPNSSCQCYLTTYALTLLNCSQTLTDLPIFREQNVMNVTRIVAPNAFRSWPSQLCKYKNIQILDLSGSNFSNSAVNFSCLSQLIYVNLSRSELTETPQFYRKMPNNLQFIDVSRNYLKRIDGIDFRYFQNLISLFLQENPIEFIDNLSEFFLLPRLQSLNLISSSSNMVQLRPQISEDRWEKIAERWSNMMDQSFVLRTKNLPFQSLISSTISSSWSRIIFTRLLESTIISSGHTPKCNCPELRLYQRLFSNIDSMKKYSSPLFESTSCLLVDGVTNARLFDRRTILDFHCPLLGGKNLFSSIPRLSTGSTLFLNVRWFSRLILVFISCFVRY